MDHRRVALLVTVSLILMPAIVIAAQGQLASDLFKIQFGDNGITSLKRVKDIYDTEYIAPGGSLGNLVIRHSLIAGNSSWVFWQRSNAEGPFLVMVPQGKSKFEYFGSAGVAAGGGMGGGFTPFIHSTVSSATPIATGGRWRLPITSLKLAPRGTPGDAVTYTFKFGWAPDFEGVREVLYNEGSFDTNSVGTMNEAFLPELIRALENEGRKAQADKVRGLWESKVERFVICSRP